MPTDMTVNLVLAKEVKHSIVYDDPSGKLVSSVYVKRAALSEPPPKNLSMRIWEG